MKNHTLAKCWRLHGYPKNKGKRLDAPVTHVNTEQNDETRVVHATFTTEQHKQLMEYLDKF